MNYVLNDERYPLDLFHGGDAVRAYDFLGAHDYWMDGVPGLRAAYGNAGSPIWARQLSTSIV